MKQKGLVLSCVMVFCLVVGVFSDGAAYNLTMDAMDKDGTVTTEFTAGSELNLNINLDAGSGGVAACAFTLEWTPIDALTPPTTTDGVSTDITSIFPFKTTVGGTASDTHRENSIASEGIIRFAGAEITDKGGSKIHPFDVTLFTAKFKVKATSGSIKFTLKQTELLNEAAGWGKDGVPGAVPIIVGAVPNTDAKFGGNLSDDFPVMLASFSTGNPTHIVTIGGDYEAWKTANGYNNPDIGGPTDDYDRDGFTNDQERNNNTDPTADTANPVDAGVDVTEPDTWTDMGIGYNALKDFRVANLDIDGNGTATIGEDGVLLIRYLFGFRDNTLIDGAVGAGATRNTATMIQNYIAAVNEAVYDVDASGKPTLGEDGVIILRYMFGYRGADLINGAYDVTYCKRCTADEIEKYILLLFPN